jgi:signal transduction histidine kinase
MDITLVYFIYGLAFFSMGLAMLLESARSPLLAEASVLLPLAVFGFVHGGHEWLEMFLDKSGWLAIQNPVLLSWVRVFILLISFVSLLVFALRMLRPEKHIVGQRRIFWLLGLAGYVLLVFLFALLAWSSHADHLTHVDASLRYFLAVPVAALAGLAMRRRASQAQRDGNSGLGLSFSVAAVGFLVYAATQIVVPPLDIFPGNALNTASFNALAGFPIQVVRAAMAVMITVSLLQGIQAAEAERQKQFMAAQQARLDALEQVRLDLVERETMRQELLRHIVIAQEEERARIARELHDETAQILTAFSFHLATLRKVAPRNSKIIEQLHYLQNLSRQMSEGIYRLVRDLRPAQLDDLGLVPALQYLVEEARHRLDLQIDFRVLGDQRRLDSLVETVLFRVAQEAITNVARHAGVFIAQMELEFEVNQLTLQVIDQGIGFDARSFPNTGSGWGVAGMYERAESIGGRLTLTSTPGSGTVVKIIAPTQMKNNTTPKNETLHQAIEPKEEIWTPSA